MPISFCTIPDHIKICIAQKQNIQDFAKLHECSRACSKFAQNMRYKVITDSWNIDDNFYTAKKENPQLSIWHRSKKLTIPLKSANDAPIQIMGNTLYICALLTEELCSSLIGFMKSTKSTVNGLHVQKIDCCRESLNALVEVSKIDKFLACVLDYDTNPRNFLTLPAIENLLHLHINRCSIEDFELETLKMPCLDLYETNISCVGINLLLKEWLNNQRKISRIRVSFKEPVEKAVVFNGIPYSVRMADKADRKIYIVKNGRGDEIRVTVEITYAITNNVYVVIELPN